MILRCSAPLLWVIGLHSGHGSLLTSPWRHRAVSRPKMEILDDQETPAVDDDPWVVTTFII